MGGWGEGGVATALEARGKGGKALATRAGRNGVIHHTHSAPAIAVSQRPQVAACGSAAAPWLRVAATALLCFLVRLLLLLLLSRGVLLQAAAALHCGCCCEWTRSRLVWRCRFLPEVAVPLDMAPCEVRRDSQEGRSGRKG